MWYFTPFYAMLRAVPDKLGGVIVMFAAVLILFVLPWLDRSKVRSIRYKGWISKVAMITFAINFVVLAWLGLEPPSDAKTLAARVGTVIYFLFFLLMPIYTKMESTKPVPARVTS